jgi:TRAP transporter TAXI family solute receptor
MAAMGGDGRRNLRTVKCCRVLALSMTFLVAIAGGVFAQRTFTWAAGPAGGGWYAISTGMAHILRDKVDLSVKVVPGGGAQNPVLVDRGEAEIGMSVRPLLEAATRGETPYRGTKLENVRALAGNMSPTVVHFYVGADSPFAKMTLEEIVRGKKPIRLAIPKPGTSDVWVLEKTMEFFGLCEPGKTTDCYKSWESVGAKFVRGSYAEQAVDFKERKVDGVFAILALPAEAVTDASERRALTLLACPQPLLEALAAFGLDRGVIPAETYPKAVNASANVMSATMGTTIIVSAAMTDDVAYTITKTINDNADRWRGLHPSLADYDPSKGWLHLGVALHAGAERYYREQGWLR